MKLTRLTPGINVSGIPGNTWNEFCNAAEQTARRDQCQEPYFRPPPGILIRNQSEYDCDTMDVLGFKEIDVELLDGNPYGMFERPVLVGEAPTASHLGKFLVSLQPIPAGELGYAICDGLAFVRLKSKTPVWRTADVDPEDRTQLKLDPRGSAKVLWMQEWGANVVGTEEGYILGTEDGDLLGAEGTGNEIILALVRLGSPQELSYCGVADEPITHDASGTVSLWYEGADSGENIEGELDCAHCDQDIEEGDEVIVTWQTEEERWRITPAPCKESISPDFTCAKICYWVPECCLYRAITSTISESTDWCDDIPAERDSVWVVHDLFTTLLPEDFEDPIDYYCNVAPEQMLSIGALGWVRKVADEFTCTYTPAGEQDPTTETLPVYQWCWFKFENCPPKERTMTARTSSADCEDAVGHSTTLSWYETVPGPPENLADCSTAYEWGFANETDCVGIWVGEFDVPTTHQIRLVACMFDKPGMLDVVGWIHPNWCTGEIEQLYEVKAGFNEPVPYDGPYSNLTRLAGCRLLYNGSPTPLRESITYRYRLLVACSVNEYGELDVPRCCVEHITPDCHPYPGEALADDAIGRRSFSVCGSTLIIDYDFEFGSSSSREDSIGWWDDVTEQYADHRFAGCFNDLDAQCDFLTTLTTERWKLTLTW